MFFIRSSSDLFEIGYNILVSNLLIIYQIFNSSNSKLVLNSLAKKNDIYLYFSSDRLFEIPIGPIQTYS